MLAFFDGHSVQDRLKLLLYEIEVEDLALAEVLALRLELKISLGLVEAKEWSLLGVSSSIFLGLM